MYLISIYFDEKTTKTFESYIRQVEKHTGNHAMTNGSIPPHITVAAFYIKEEQTAIKIFEKIAAEISSGELNWVALGCFLPNVLFLEPVLNEYLHDLSTLSYKAICVAGAKPHERYIPFQWMPHTTIGKLLTQEQMQIAFSVMQNQFSTLKGKAVSIGLAKTNPYADIMRIVLK